MLPPCPSENKLMIIGNNDDDKDYEATVYVKGYIWLVI